MQKDKGLLVIDVQQDFCPAGALPVPEGDNVVTALNEYIDYFVQSRWPVIFTRDWHPKDSQHFEAQGGKWPSHCVEGTPGARFPRQLSVPAQSIVVSKGMERNQDGSSAFEGVNSQKYGLQQILKASNIKELWVGGLATDYCVQTSVLDALKSGYRVKLLVDAIRGLDIHPGDSKKAIDEMVRAGAQQMTRQGISHLQE